MKTSVLDETKVLGSVELGDHVIVSDPCYAPGTWCAGGLLVKPGRWAGEAGIMDGRVAVLFASHKSSSAYMPKSMDDLSGWTKEGFEVGVDSGQAGIFDQRHYRKDASVLPEDIGDICPDEPWYSHCCKITCGEDRAGACKVGFVSSSGWGDGGYTCWTLRDKDGKVVAICINFLLEDNPEEDE